MNHLPRDGPVLRLMKHVLKLRQCVIHAIGGAELYALHCLHARDAFIGYSSPLSGEITQRRSEAVSSVAPASPLRDRKAERSEVSRVRRDRQRGSRHARGDSERGAVDSASGCADALGIAQTDRRGPCVYARLHRFPGITPFPQDDLTSFGPCLSPVRNRHDLPAVGPLGERTHLPALCCFTSGPIRAYRVWVFPCLGVAVSRCCRVVAYWKSPGHTERNLRDVRRETASITARYRPPTARPPNGGLQPASAVDWKLRGTPPVAHSPSSRSGRPRRSPVQRRSKSASSVAAASPLRDRRGTGRGDRGTPAEIPTSATWTRRTGVLMPRERPRPTDGDRAFAQGSIGFPASPLFHRMTSLRSAPVFPRYTTGMTSLRSALSGKGLCDRRCAVSPQDR